VDRRFATLGAGARVHDPEGLYAVDLLTGERPTGEPRAILEAYVRAANEIARATDHEIFAQHGELARVLSYLPGRVDDAAAKVIDLHRRHAAEVEDVLDAGIREHASALRRGTLPRSSLLVLALPAEPTEPRPTMPSRPPRVAPPGVVRILHLSDLHFSKRRAWDQDPVLASLARDVARLRDEGLAPDLVAITGDVADRGTPEEYALATSFVRERLLPAAGLDAARLLLVPGNHDVDRSAVKRVAQAAQTDLLRAESQDAIAAIIGDAAERAPLLRRHDAWLSFVRGLGVAHGELPWWSQRVAVGALSIHVAGLCTSWASWCDEDKGRLLLGRVQLHQALEGAERADLAIALMHHPWDYLADFDAAEARETIHRRCDVLLRGHLHKGEGATRIRPDGGSIELAAGASWGGSQHLHGYQMIELEPAREEARVHLRTWDGHDWIPDRNAYRGAAPDGVARFPLRSRR
jgi:predicted MPP superfamily phosphohydrolase